MARSFIVFVLLGSMVSPVPAADGPSFFRQDQGVAGADFALPEQFAAKELLVWRQELSPGISTPCVHGDLVVLTTWEQDRKQFVIFLEQEEPLVPSPKR